MDLETIHIRFIMSLAMFPPQDYYYQQYPYQQQQQVPPQAAYPVPTGYFNQPPPDYYASQHHAHYVLQEQFRQPQQDLFVPAATLQEQFAPAPQEQYAPVAHQGGVSAVLDYNVGEIVKFLSLLSVNIFKSNDDEASIKYLESRLKNVISDTRLPKSSILMSILYLSHKMAVCNDDGYDIYTNVIISLLLANKFNDDSTFTNKSWSLASGLEISLISRLEIEFLKHLSYDLKTIVENSAFDVLDKTYTNWCIDISPVLAPAPAPATMTSVSPPSPYTDIEFSSSPLQNPYSGHQYYPYQYQPRVPTGYYYYCDQYIPCY